MKQVMDKISDAMMFVSCTSVSICILINAFEITMRYLFGHSMFWIQDVTALLILWFIFPGVVTVTYRGNDIAVSFFVEHMPRKIQAALEVFVDVIVTLFSGLLLYFSIELFLLRIGQVMVTSRIPMNLYTLSIVLSMGLLVFVYLNKLLANLSRRKGVE